MIDKEESQRNQMDKTKGHRKKGEPKGETELIT